MDVGIDQTRQDSLPFQIDDGSVAGRRNFSSANGSNALALDDDRDAVARLVADTVNQPSILEYDTCHIEPSIVICAEQFRPSKPSRYDLAYSAGRVDLHGRGDDHRLM